MPPVNGGPALICFDGSDEARHAIERAGPLLRGASAIVLTSWEVLTIAVGGYPIDEFTTGLSFEQLDQTARERAERLAADGAQLARTHCFDPEPLVRQGPPAEAIIEVARDRQASVVVIGSHGRTGLRATMLGSVSNAVIHHAPCPVLVVRTGD
jgi:nucleotide-binding universal stress UspA family protein